MTVMSDLLDLSEMLTSWLRQLRRENRSRHTLEGYSSAVRSFLRFCADTGRPAELTHEAVADYLDSRTGQVSTTRLHLTVLKLFGRWLADEEGFDATGVLAVRPPKADERAVPDVSEDELARLIKACEGTALRDKRDKALLMMFAETGLRAAEMLALQVTDVDLDRCEARVARGKGGKARSVYFGVGTAAALDRYVRARARVVSHPAGGPMWLSRHGRPLSYTGLTTTLKERAEAAGVIGFHLHRLRHTMAVRWLRAGGSEVGLRAHAGWTSNTMVARYVKAASEDLAGEEFRRLDLGLPS